MSVTPVVNVSAPSKAIEVPSEVEGGESSPRVLSVGRDDSQELQAGVAPVSAVDRVNGMTRSQIIGAIESQEFTLRELSIWAARFPEEVPLVNGEFPWIALSLADLD